jgi:hypothetical protein
MKILIVGIFITGLLFFLSTNSDVLIYGQEEESKNDLVFSVQGLQTSPITKDFQINGEVWEEICPSNQCQIEEDYYSTYIVTPDPSDTGSTSIHYVVFLPPC